MIRIKIRISKAAITALALVAALFVTIPVADAASGAKPQVLCIQKSGAVVSRTSCKAGETRFSALPGVLKAVPKTAQTISNAQPLSQLAVPLATTISTAAILSSTPRIYTSLVTIPANTAIGTQYFNTPEMPTCPAQAPLMLDAWPVAIVDNDPLALVYSFGPEAMYTERIEGTAYDSDWSILTVAELLNPTVSTDKTFRITLGVEGNRTTTGVLPRDVKFYLSVMCAPVVDLVVQ